MVRKAEIVNVEGLRGGVGRLEMHHILKKEELNGHGTFIDHDRTRIPVGPGDVCMIACGQGHALENDSDEELVLMALVYNE